MEQSAAPDAEAQHTLPEEAAAPVEAAQDGEAAAPEAAQDAAKSAEKAESVTADEEEEADAAPAAADGDVEDSSAVDEQEAEEAGTTADAGEDTQTTAPDDKATAESVAVEEEAVAQEQDGAAAKDEVEQPLTLDREGEVDQPSTPDEEEATDAPPDGEEETETVAVVSDAADECSVGEEDAVVEKQDDVSDSTDAGDEEKLEEPLTIVAPVAAAAEVEKEDESTPMGADQPEAPRTLILDPDATKDVTTNDQTPVSGGVLDNLIGDGVVATPDGVLQMPQELASPAAMPELLVAAAEQADTENGADLGAFEAEMKESEQEQEDNGEKSQGDSATEDGDHATITAVAESAEKTPLDANLEVVLERIRNKLPCEVVGVLESGEILVLPKGWSTRQSKTNDGKTYYVSPYGHTQWLRPPMKTGVIYNWVHQIEVTFGPGRLGLNLKQIAGIPGTEFTDLQVHIAEIYKLPNGMASPAEIYNWSVKPEKRLALNMRVAMMNNISLAGYTYSEVLELLARLPRPIRIKFADISKGIVGRVEEEIPHEETEEAKEARAARVMQSSLRMEYFQIMVSYELHKQVWAVTKTHMHQKFREMEKKCEVMLSQVEGEEQHQVALEKEREDLIQEAVSLKEMIEQLDKQTAGEIESPEVLRSTELVRRTAEIEKEVTEIIAENDELQSARVKIEESLDTLQNELDEYGDLDIDPIGQYDIKFFSPAFLGSMVQRGSIDTRAEDARERLLEKIKAQRGHLEEDIKMEEERSTFVESEIHQFRKQMDVAAAAVKREDAFISGERPPQIIFLENKIALLRKNLRETVAGIAKATNSGDQQQADNLSLRRADLKDDLKTALDEMRRMESELKVFFDVDQGRTVAVLHAADDIDSVNIDEAPHERLSETSRLEGKLTRLQTQLHDTVAQLAKAASEKDEVRKNELSRRRLQLKDEMKVVQDQFQVLTNGTLNVSVKGQDSYLRPSVVGPPTMQIPRSSTGGSRASIGGGIRGSVGGGRASIGGHRASMGGNRASASTHRASEQFDPSQSHRSSSSASMSSMTHSMDSNTNQIPRDGSAPTMSGLLRKHPTHSNEKGTFGNMSLRGVRERWCVIDPDGNLRYYKREGDREPRGLIPLKHKSLEILYGKDVGKPNEFMICSPTYQTRMVAKTHEEMLRWVKTLELAHKYFMQQAETGRGSIDGHPPGSVSSSRGSNADQQTPDAELAYRNQRATLGF